MAVRITTIEQASGTTIRVDGRLQAVDVDELMREMSRAGDLVSIDLSDLKSADREAARFLRGLIAQGVVLHAATPYVHLLLNTATDHT